MRNCFRPSACSLIDHGRQIDGSGLLGLAAMMLVVVAYDVNTEIAGNASG
jgi:hypothetical protein